MPDPHVTDAITIKPPDAKGYPGQTKLWLEDGRAIVIMSVDDDAERRLREMAARRK